jgi:predicted transcriptional regulator
VSGKPTITARVLMLHAKGLSVPEIAEAIGRTDVHVRSVLNKNGLGSRWAAGRPRNVQPERLQSGTVSGTKKPLPGEFGDGSE